MPEPHTNDIPWTWSDVWVFAAVMGSHGVGPDGVHPASLEAVIETADYINRAIVSRNELDGAFARLSAAGLIRIDDERVAATPAGDALWLGAKQGSFLDIIERIGTGLGLAPPVKFDPQHHDARWTTGWLTNERMDNAVSAYRVSFQRRVDEMRRRDDPSQ
jgi:hypothetical protein